MHATTLALDHEPAGGELPRRVLPAATSPVGAGILAPCQTSAAPTPPDRRAVQQKNRVAVLVNHGQLTRHPSSDVADQLGVVSAKRAAYDRAPSQLAAAAHRSGASSVVQRSTSRKPNSWSFSDLADLAIAEVALVPGDRLGTVGVRDHSELPRHLASAPSGAPEEPGRCHAPVPPGQRRAGSPCRPGRRACRADENPPPPRSPPRSRPHATVRHRSPPSPERGLDACSPSRAPAGSPSDPREVEPGGSGTARAPSVPRRDRWNPLPLARILKEPRIGRRESPGSRESLNEASRRARGVDCNR